MLIRKSQGSSASFFKLLHISTVFQYICWGKLHVSGPAQFKPVLFTGQLQFAASTLLAPIPNDQVKTLY